MGLEKKEVGNFITIYNGKFSQKIKKPDNVVSPEDIEKFLKENNAVSRVNKLGTTVYEQYHDSFTGKLVSIKVKDGEYGKDWVFGFQDQNEVYLLQLSYTNSFATQILKMLPNADLTKEMRLTPQVKIVDGKNKASIFINQDGKALKHAYTREVPNGLPEWKNIVVKGVTVGDNTDQMVFLENMVDATIIPKLGGAVVERSHAGPINETVAKDSLDTAVEELQAGAVDTDSEPF